MGNEPIRQCIIPLHKPSLKELIFFFSCGILVSFPFVLFFNLIYPFFPYAIVLIILAPFIEELAKVFPLFYRHGETERSLVILGALIGLGFGISELVLYVFFYGQPLIVRIPPVFFHASSATITAYGVAKKKPLPYYLIATSLHITNNFFAFEDSGLFGWIVATMVLIAAYLLAWRFYHQASVNKIVD